MLVRVWAIVLPLPAEDPVTLPGGTMSTVHANVVPPTVELNAIPVVPAEQIVSEGGVAVTIGSGLITTTVEADAEQPLRSVTVKV